MGCKTGFEKLFSVRIGERGFRSGLPTPLICPCVLLFFGIFFVVAGILLCILHQTYVVARHDELYGADNYFLIAGVIALCLGVLIVFVGMGWCYHTHTTQAERIEDYNMRKGYSSENVNKYAPSIAAVSDHSINRTYSNNEYPPDYPHGHRQDRWSESQMSHMSQPGQYPHEHRQDRYSQGQISHMSHPDQHPDPNDPHYAPRSPPKDDVATRVSRGANKGFDDFKSFVKRNKAASTSDSPKRRPYSERLSPPTQGYTDDDDLARKRGHYGSESYGGQNDEDKDFELARTYIQNPYKYYAQDDAQRIEDKHSGYEVMPVDDPHRRQQRGTHPSDVNNRLPSNSEHAQPPNPAKRSAAYKYDKGRPLDSSQDSNPPGNNPIHAQQPPKSAYKYDKGRPLDSSQDSSQSFGTDNSVSMETGGASGVTAPPPRMAPPPKEAGKEKATLVYNPKDGQWYYYYKGKPISKYDPDMKGAGPAGGPVYKYIHGKPVLLPHPPQMP